MKSCHIVGAGECNELIIKKESGDLIIAADGGYAYLEKAGIKPDIAIGDFDSLNFSPVCEKVIKLNPIKDITDMYAAVNVGIEEGYSCFHLYGATGGRIDHTIANIQLIASLAQNKMKAFIHDGNTVITAICNDSLEFSTENKGYISVFSHSEKCSGVYLKGLKYMLENAELTNTFPLGVSNEFIGEKSEIIIGNGTAIVTYSLNY
ncbi:MAG: thiamine diphosphokinase [Oscillospiraceae bacterium]|nr:thiamine diphosphokinase [Oscillospiraceae bacterium]